jgi:hypothetical protein
VILRSNGSLIVEELGQGKPPNALRAKGVEEEEEEECIPKKLKCFGMKIHKHCNITGHTDTRICLGKGQAKCNGDSNSYTCKVRSINRSLEGVHHKLYMDSFFSPDMFGDLCTGGMNCCGIVRH